MIGQLLVLVDLAQALLVVGWGLVEGLPPLLSQDRGPALAPCRGLVLPYAFERPRAQRAAPLIGGHRRPAAAGDSRRRIL